MNRIGIVAYADRLSGGIYQYTLSLIDALKHDDSFRYVIITKEGNDQFDGLGLEVRKLESSGNVVRKLGNALLLLLKVRSPLFYPLSDRMALADIDIFVSTGPSPYPYFFFDKPFIFTLHDLQERYFPRFFSVSDRVRRWLNARALTHAASCVITESRFVKADTIKFLRVPEQMVVVLPAPPTSHFLDKTFTTEELETVSQKYGLPENYLLYPAQIWHHKNHRKLLEALGLLREKYADLHLVLTGAEKSGYRLLRDRIQQLKLEDRVLYLGYIDYEDLPAVYRLSRMLVMPSLFESISIPVYEAFSLRVPVVCSNVVALPEQVQDAGLLFDPHDAVDMAKQVDRILSDAIFAEQLAQRGYQLVKKFDHKCYMQQLRGIFDKITN